MADLQTIRKQMLEARRRFLTTGEGRDEMMALAETAAALYNEGARRVAAKLGQRPRLTTPDRILRQGEFLR